MTTTPAPLAVAVALGFFACAPTIPKEADSGPAATSTTETVDCDVVLEETTPFDGQTDTYWRDPFTFSFSEPDPTATVVFDPSGTATWDDSETTLTFTPAAPLAPNTDYTVGIDFCRSSPELSFRTSELGSPITDPASLVGRTYAVDLSAGRFVEGAGIAEPLSAFFNRSVLFQVTHLDATGLDLRVAVSGTPTDPAGQDQCFATIDMVDLDPSEAPFFAFDLDDFVLGAWEGSLALAGFSMEGTVAPDGTYVGGVQYSVVVPVSQLGAVFGNDDVAENCALIEAQGEVCETCPDFSDAACVTISADRITALSLDADLTEVVVPTPDCG